MYLYSVFVIQNQNYYKYCQYYNVVYPVLRTWHYQDIWKLISTLSTQLEVAPAYFCL